MAQIESAPASIEIAPFEIAPMSPRRTLRRAYRPRIDRLDDRWLPAALGLSAAQLAAAYGLGVGSADGNGQVIAVVGAYNDPYLTTDLATFDQANGLYGTNATEVSGFVSQVDLSGGRTDDGWAGEAALDVEAIRVMAPAAPHRGGRRRGRPMCPTSSRPWTSPSRSPASRSSR